MIPVADDAEPLELLALHLEPVLGERAALAAEGVDRLRVVEARLLAAVGAVLLLDLPLDGETVAVPARHVVAVVAEHLLALHDQVLQDLVQRMADVDVAVGVGRPVVEHELGPALGGFTQLVVEPDLAPAREQFRLEVGQPGLHGEIGLGQEERLAPVAAPALRFSCCCFRPAVLGHRVPLVGSERVLATLPIRRKVRSQHVNYDCSVILAERGPFPGRARRGYSVRVAEGSRKKVSSISFALDPRTRSPGTSPGRVFEDDEKHVSALAGDTLRRSYGLGRLLWRPCGRGGPRDGRRIPRIPAARAGS